MVFRIALSIIPIDVGTDQQSCTFDFQAWISVADFWTRAHAPG